MQTGDEEEVMDDDSTCDELERFDPPKVLGDILEALAAAVFLDSGRNLETVWRVFKPILADTPLFGLDCLFCCRMSLLSLSH